jgi:hypothetical protein
LEVEKNLFSKSGDLIIKCTATIDPYYWKSAEKFVKREQKSYYLSLWNLGKKNRKKKSKIFSDLSFMNSGSAKQSSSSSEILPPVVLLITLLFTVFSISF